MGTDYFETIEFRRERIEYVMLSICNSYTLVLSSYTLPNRHCILPRSISLDCSCIGFSVAKLTSLGLKNEELESISDGFI